MKAIQFINYKTPLTLVSLAYPKPEEGTAIVKLLASHVPSFSSSVFDGSLGYTLPAKDKFTPGTSAVGVVEVCETSNGVIKTGDLVFFDNYVYAKNSSGKSEAILMGWTGLGEKSSLAQQRWSEGVWSEKFICPVENLHVIPSNSKYTAEQWESLNYLNVAYGALLKAEFKPGMNVVVNGAAGGLGSCVVLIALGLGAATITAVGRNEEALQVIKALSPHRIKTVNSDCEPEIFTASIKEAAGGADIVIDALGGAKTHEPTLACIQSLKKGGIAVFMGNVLVDIPLGYMAMVINETQVRGSFMYPPDAPYQLIKFIASGLIDLGAIQTVTYPLDRINKAMEAAGEGGPLRFIMLTPGNITF